MGKLASSITPKHWLQLKSFLFNRLRHLTGFTTINFIIVVYFNQKLLKKRRSPGERERTVLCIQNEYGINTHLVIPCYKGH